MSTTDAFHDLNTDKEILQRTYARGESAETYAPTMLLDEIMGLLRDRGLHPDLPEREGRVGMLASRPASC